MINLCENRRVLGVSCAEYRQNGAFAEFVTVPERILYRLPEPLQFEHAALVEPFAIALHAIRRSPPKLNDSVVVMGAGMIGLALVQGLRQAGCGQIIVVDVMDERLATAMRFGATSAINSGKANVVEEILKLTNGDGADIAFEAVGVTATVESAISCARKGG